MTELPPLTRLLMTAEVLDDTGVHSDDAEVLREVHNELAAQLADRDQLHTALTARDVALRHACEAAERLATELARVTQELADEEAVHEQMRQRAVADRQVRDALTELRAASRGLAFFDQIKCARWNAAYQQATQVLGLEDET